HDAEVYWYHNDVSGMPRELTGAGGDIAWRAEYRAWGNTLRVEHIETRSGEPVYQPLRYQGQYFDAETGLHYNRFRYYDPDAGRFISQDPIGLAGGINLYQYAPNPLVWVDPLGLRKKCNAKRTKHVPNRHIRRHNNIGNSKFSLKERTKLQAKSKYRKPSQYRKIENRTMKNPSRIIHQGDGRIRYEKEYDRVIGTRGEKGHVTIYDPSKDKIVASYPAHLED
ncbi:RHS domain-containing protein, partial [Cronobacter turicensis]|nr:RHS domain-containing protein [Cronobacter turicensis]